MDDKGDRSGRHSTRRARRARRLRWAGALAGLAAAASVASAQAAQQEAAAAALQSAFSCTQGIHLGYEVSYDEHVGGFAVFGMVVNAHADECAGRDVVVVLQGAAGEQLASGRVALAEGATVWFDDAAPVDARDVAAVQVLLDA